MPSYDFSSGLMGGGLGALQGSQFGPWGALAGGILGGLGGFGGGGRQDELKKFATMTPEQMNVLNSILGQVGGGQLSQGNTQALSNLQELLNPSSSAYQRFEAPYLQEFQNQVIPGIAERFASAGPLSGALSSSGFGQALSTAGGQLQTGLASLKSQLQRQAANDILGQYNRLSGLGLQAQPFGYTYQPGSPSFGQSALTGWLGAGMPGLNEGLQGFGNMFGSSPMGMRGSFGGGGR